MPMPEQNTEWPPPGFLAAQLAYAENDAWWTGDREALSKLYGGTHELSTYNVRNNVLQDVVRKLKDRARTMFWGPRNQVTTPGSRPLQRSHLPAPANLATLSSDLQFAQSPTFLVPGMEPDEKNDAVTLMNDTMNTDRVLAALGVYGETKSALGAAICIPQWNKELAPGEVWFESYGPDVAVPEFESGRLKAVTLWSQVVEGNVYWRLLAHHGVENGAGYVEYALFEGKRDNLGPRVDLRAHYLGQPIADMPELDSSSRIATGLKRLDAVYGINSPTIEWRKDPLLRYAGRSDFAQLHGLFDDLDQGWSSWMRDLRLGRGRLFIPESYMQNLGRGQGAAFDELAEYVVRAQMPGDISDSGNLPIHGQQFDIRVDEHERTLNAAYREILRKAGFSPSAWGDGGGQDGGQITATEVDDRNAASERTRKKKNMHDRQTLGELARIMLEIQSSVNGKGAYMLDELPVVEFPDSTTESPHEIAETITLLNAAGAISLLEKVSRANPHWTSAQVTEEVKAIQAERGQALPDPSTLGRVMNAVAESDDDEPEGDETDVD